MNRFKTSKFKNCIPQIPKKEGWIGDIEGASTSSNGNNIKCENNLIVYNTDSPGVLGITSLQVEEGQSRKSSRLNCHSDVVTDFACSPFDDKLLVTGSADQTVKLWHVLETGDVEDSSGSLAAKGGPVKALVFHPSADAVLASASGKSAQIWDLNKETSIAELDDHGDQVQSISWSQDGSLIGSSSKDKGVKKRNPNFTSEEVRQLVTMVMDRLYPFDRQLPIQEKNFIWNDICDKLNAFSQQLNPRPPIRNVSLIKKRWQDFKTMLKKKIAERKRHSNRYAGKPIPEQLRLSDLEEMAIRCVMDQEIVGVGDQTMHRGITITYVTAVPTEPRLTEALHKANAEAVRPVQQPEISQQPPSPLPPDVCTVRLKEEDSWVEETEPIPSTSDYSNHMQQVDEMPLKNVQVIDDLKCIWEEMAQDNRRHHEAMEREAFRHNQTLERETYRHNEVMERETVRHNEAMEQELTRHNEAKEQKLDMIGNMLKLLVSSGQQGAPELETSSSDSSPPAEGLKMGQRRQSDPTPEPGGKRSKI